MATNSEKIKEIMDLTPVENYPQDSPPPCQTACPVGTDIPSYVGLIWDGELEKAVEAISGTNPFSSICGRVCASPCESACKRSELDGAVTIRNLKRYVMDRLGEDYHLPPVTADKTETIAVVGGGPAGLTAAQDLAEAGYEVHIYERSDRLGGMMNAIPPFRLPRELIERDIQRLLDHCPDVKVHLNSGLGHGVTLEELKKRHRAVLLTIGLQDDRLLNVPGEDQAPAGVHGMDFLMEISRGQSIRLEGRTLVIGGGNVAMDMARTALRSGAAEVHVYCLESREEMPAWEHEIRQAEQEGVVIHNGWGPERLIVRDRKIVGVDFKECLSVFDEAGKFNPVYGDGKKEVPAEAMLLAIGLQAGSEHLEQLGLLTGGLVRPAGSNMQTSDPMVFTAGDCADGPSSIVRAMRNGHAAAHYIKAYIEGVRKPAPYHPPYRTRRIAMAQDPMWEKLAREEAPFHGLSDDCSLYSECESVFDPEAARRQAARCLRCDAETGSANFSRRARGLIQAMSETDPGDITGQAALLHDLMQPRDNPFPPSRPAHIDDLVFMSAALTRLVIDPYRESCNSVTRISRSRPIGIEEDGARFMELAQPFFVTGFDQAPSEVRQSLAAGLASTGCGYIGRNRPAPEGNPGPQWIQLLLEGDIPDPAAQGLAYVMGAEFRPVQATRLCDDQLLGLSVGAAALEKAIPFALDNAFDFLILDGFCGVDKPFCELAGHPDLTVLRDAFRILRRMNMEEEIALIYFGGMKSGTDAAKVLALNCNASTFGVAAALAIGGAIEGENIDFSELPGMEERTEAVENWIKAIAQETAIIARCTGKTNVHNLEPEDMRSISIAASQALDLPLTSGQTKREWF